MPKPPVPPQKQGSQPEASPVPAPGANSELDTGDTQLPEHLEGELDATRAALAGHEAAGLRESREQRLRSWDRAQDIVKKFRPVPWLVWQIVRAAFGKPGKSPELSFGVFNPLDRLILFAATHKVFAPANSNAGKKIYLSEATARLGTDVAAALCFMHAICRRIGVMLPERIWRPILDDALIRARIGHMVGSRSSFGRGRAMLAGFSGRSGLAIQIASGDLDQARKILEALAQGLDINQAGLFIYGCEPLQVAALALTASGCSREAAFGTASYTTKGDGIVPGSEEFSWLAAFSICEGLRMNDLTRVEPAHWAALSYGPNDRDELIKEIKLMQRKGHSLEWISWPQQAMERVDPAS